MGRPVLYCAVTELLLVPPALYPALNVQPAAHRQLAHGAGVSAPCYAGQIVRFIEGAVAGYEHVAYLPQKGRSPEHRRLAKIS